MFLPHSDLPSAPLPQTRTQTSTVLAREHYFLHPQPKRSQDNTNHPPTSGICRTTILFEWFNSEGLPASLVIHSKVLYWIIKNYVPNYTLYQYKHQYTSYNIIPYHIISHIYHIRTYHISLNLITLCCVMLRYVILYYIILYLYMNNRYIYLHPVTNFDQTWIFCRSYKIIKQLLHI